jgi:hypothetical protein
MPQRLEGRLGAKSKSGVSQNVPIRYPTAKGSLGKDSGKTYKVGGNANKFTVS